MGIMKSFLLGTFKDDPSRDGTRVGSICYNKQMLSIKLYGEVEPTVKSHMIGVQNTSKLGEKA